MGAFRSVGDDLKFSQIVDKYTKHVTDDFGNNLSPVEYNLSDFYRGGRYILERKDTYTVFPDVPDDSPTKLQDNTLTATGAGSQFAYLLIMSNSTPEVGDIIRAYHKDTGEVLPDSDCPRIGSVLHHSVVQQQAVAAGLAVPLYESMTAKERGIFNTVYWIQTVMPETATIGNSKVTHKLQEGDKTGIVTDWKDRFGRCRLEVYRNDVSYRKDMNSGNSGKIVNPSSNIPVEIPNDEDGTEIKFSDFWGGVGAIDVQKVQTSWQSSWQTVKSAEVDSTRQTAKNTGYQTQYKKQIQTSKTQYWQQPYQQVYSQPYSYSTNVYRQSTTRKSTYTPGYQETRQVQLGPGVASNPFQYSYQGQRTFQGPPFQATKWAGTKQNQATRKATKQAFKTANSTKSWSWTKSWYKQTAKSTNVQTNFTEQFSENVQTSRQTSFNTKYTFWE